MIEFVLIILTMVVFVWGLLIFGLLSCILQQVQHFKFPQIEIKLVRQNEEEDDADWWKKEKEE